MLRRYLPLILILVVGAGVRCAYLPADPYPYDQSQNHGEEARNIIDHGRWFVLNTRALSHVTALRAQQHKPIDPADVSFAPFDAHPIWQQQINEVIGPGAVLAGVWTLSGSQRYVYGEIFQIIVDLGALLLLYRIAMLLFKRRRAALIAAALYAVFLPIARQTAIVAPDIWGVDFTIAVVASYLEAMCSPHRWRWLILCGLVTGVGAYFRPNVLVLPALLALVTLPWQRWREPLRAGVVVTAVAALLLVPWTIHNYVHFHHFIPTRLGAGLTLWQGLGEIHNNYGAQEDDVATYLQVHRARPDLAIATPAFDSYLINEAVGVIKRHPLFYAEVVARRVVVSTIALYDSAWMHANTESPQRYRALTGRGPISYVVNRPLDLLQGMFEPLVFILAMISLALTWRGRAREHALLIAVVLGSLLSYWVLHFEARYALPTELAYVVWIGLGADVLIERVRPRLRLRLRLRRARVARSVS